MLLNLTLTGDRELIAKLDALPAHVAQFLRGRIEVLTIRLQSYIITGKLHGQVLHQRSGQLARSIHRRIEAAQLAVFGFVFSAGDVKYAAIHEFGGRTPPHDIYPKKAEALAFAIGGKMIFAKVVHHPGSVMPERSFMRSALRDQRSTIEADLRDAAVQAATMGLS